VDTSTDDSNAKTFVAFEYESIQRRDAGLPSESLKADATKHQHALEVRIATLRKEVGDLKRGRDGDRKKPDRKFDGKRKPDLDVPVCQNPKCGRRHKGKCLLDRDLDAEQKSLDFARKIKGGIGAGPTADAETRAMARANAVSFDDLNEEDNAYSTLSCSLWNPDEAFADDIHISF
jgi:hypothetical protein